MKIFLPWPWRSLRKPAGCPWQVRFAAEDELTRAWSETGSFRTAADNRGDADGNTIPDSQEISEEAAGIDIDTETGWQDGPSCLTLEFVDGGYGDVRDWGSTD